jgi:NtrC-family two-component system sensor histidine kinase KinB
MKVKSKIRLGLLFLLGIIILLAGSGSYYINYLANESEDILRENYNSLTYTKNMIDALDDKTADSALASFETNLIKQENNITEKGEQQATERLRAVFIQYKTLNRSDSLAAVLRGEILAIQELNMNAITEKKQCYNTKNKNSICLHHHPWNFMLFAQLYIRHQFSSLDCRPNSCANRWHPKNFR